jgi:hypothetical protein
MADKKISELTAASALDGTETLPVVQGGSTKKATAANLKTYVFGDMGALHAPLKITGMTLALCSIANQTTLAGSADRLQLFPWTPGEDITITAIGVECQTAVAAANAKVIVYDTSATTRGPEDLLKETANLDCSTTGYKSEAWAYTFLKGVTYWVGVRTSSTATLRATAAGGMPNIGRSASSGTGSANVIQKTLAFASAAGNPYGAVALGNLQTAQNVYDVIVTLA